MGFTTHIWKCNNCEREYIYTSRDSHPSIYHKCKLKPVKQMEKKDFEHLNLILHPDTKIDNDIRIHQYEYWQDRINLRIKYLKPLIDECENKGYQLAVISKELNDEWIELHEFKRFYKF